MRFHQRRRHRPVEVNVQIRYRPHIRRTTSRYVVVDLDVTFISLHAGRQLVGRVDRFSRSLPRMQVRIYRDGSVDLTRALVLVQGRNGRFELAVRSRDMHRRSGAFGAPKAVGVCDWDRGVVRPIRDHRRDGRLRYDDSRYEDAAFSLAPDHLGALEGLIGGRWDR